MNELYKIVILGVILFGINMLVFKVFPSINIDTRYADMYILFLNILYIFYIILPRNIDIFSNN